MSNDPIVVALEPNEEGKHVFAAASRIAASQHRDLHPINVVRPAITIYADLNFSPLTETALDWQRELLRENRAYLERIPELAANHMANLTVVEGNPIYEISNAIDKNGASLAVMGVHNRKGFKRLLGSTTHGVLNSTNCDVLAVHPNGESKVYSRVLIAVDTSDLLDLVLAKAAPYCESAERVDIVSVIVPLTRVFPSPEAAIGLQPSFAALTEDIKQQTSTKIAAAVDNAGLSGFTVDVRMGDPRDEIVAAAKENKTDLIVMGSNNRGAINRLLVGSNARGALDHTPCDVLVCRDRQ